MTELSKNRQNANYASDAVVVTDFLNADGSRVVGDGVTDCTTGIQAALDSGAGSVYLPDGTFICTTVTVATSLKIEGTGTLKRKDNYETDDTSAGDANNTLIDITAHNINVSLNGITLDGNEQNQNVNTPSGTLLRLYDVTGASGGVLALTCDNVKFINMTKAAITGKGKIGGAGEEIINVTNCLFKDGRAGIGSGDPRSVNASGFAPSYINVNDRVRCHVSNSKFIYTKTLSSVNPLDYAPVGVRFTYIDGTTNADGSRGTIINNYFYRCGRSNVGYDLTPNTNNALGVVEAYTLGTDIEVANNTFETSYSACVRAKSSINGLVVSGNILTDCRENGISIGPMGTTNGTQIGKIVVSDNIIKLVDAQGIIIVGDSTVSPAVIGNIIISNNHISDMTNINSITGNVGAIVTRYADNIVITGNDIYDIDANTELTGIKIRDSVSAIVANNNINYAGQHGVYANNITDSIVISSNMIKNCLSNGITVDSTATPDVSVTGNLIDTVVTYGVIIFDADSLNITDNIIKSVSGTSRGIYVISSVSKAILTGNITDASTPLFHTADGNIIQTLNSWNTAINYRSAAPTGGTWAVGDIVYNSAPSASGFMGWVCVTAGTPGTWKTFGAISA